MASRRHSSFVETHLVRQLWRRDPLFGVVDDLAVSSRNDASQSGFESLAGSYRGREPGIHRCGFQFQNQPSD